VNLRELAREGKEILEAAGAANAWADARTLLMDSLHIGPAEYFLYAENEPEDAFPKQRDDLESMIETYRQHIRLRASRIPLQQILGKTGFMGLEFRVNEHVLCPRQDTEVLVETMLHDYEGKDPKVLDLCCGSGCIGISLKVLGGFSDVTLSDLSEKALEIAKANDRELSGGGCRIIRGDLFAALPAEAHYDVIVSNPPYIRDDVIETLEPEVKTFEPRMALSGGEDGLKFYRRIIGRAPEFAPALYLEIGFDQAEAVAEIMKQAGYHNIRVIKDYGDNDRVIRGNC